MKMNPHCARTAPPRISDFDIELTLLLEAIYLKYQHDFRHYAMSSLRRRLTQALDEFGLTTLSQLQDRIMRSGADFARLFQYLTVQVSDMFRDPAYFLALRQQVMPVLRTYPSIKVWVAGCSTGEELWSLKILFDEEDLTERTLFYATDINPDALSACRSRHLRARPDCRLHAKLSGGGRQAFALRLLPRGLWRARFAGALKDRVVFADHSLSTDEVFLEAHLVSCRNVMIYFDRALQDRALGLFSAPLCGAAFSASAVRKVCVFRTSTKRLTNFVRASASTRSASATPCPCRPVNCRY